MSSTLLKNAAATSELHLARSFDAPRELVFRMWAEPGHMAKWSCPHGFTTTQGAMDFRPGGTWSATMRSPEGEDLRLQGSYREIVPGRRIVMTHAWLDESGKPGPETIVTVDFAELGKKTRMTFHQAGFTSQASRDGHEGGWSECFERLEAYLAELTGA